MMKCPICSKNLQENFVSVFEHFSSNHNSFVVLLSPEQLLVIEKLLLSTNIVDAKRSEELLRTIRFFKKIRGIGV